MPLLTEDRALLDGFRHGDQDALRRVYRAYLPMLCDFLRSGFGFASGQTACSFAGCRTPSDLLDAVQETFLRAFAEDARHAYDGIRPYRNYLFRIGRNVVIDQLRRGRLQAESLSPGGTTDSAGEAPADPQAAVLEKEAASLVASFVAGLPERARHVWQARFDDGLPQDEAAARVGLSRIQLRRIEARIKADLLGHLRARGYLTSYRRSTWGPILSRWRGPDDEEDGT